MRELMAQVAQKREEFALRMILHGYFPSQGWSIREDYYWEEVGGFRFFLRTELIAVPPRAVLRLPDKSKQQ